MTTKEQLEPGRVYVFKVGLLYTAACAPAEMTPEQVGGAVNVEHPTGISSAWQVSEQPFEDGPNPAPCADDPEGRLHWLLEC